MQSPSVVSSFLRAVASAIVATLVATTLLALPAAAAPPHLEDWHRLNPDISNPAPEHERLLCLPGVQWVCRYDKVPEPGLHWDRTIGMFHGSDTTTTWSCPSWLGAVCAGAERVVSGVIAFSPEDQPAFRVRNELVFTDGIGLAPLFVVWPDAGFACPWYGSFADALAASPDCLLAT